MKIIVEKKELIKGIDAAMSAVPTKATLPILENILIDAGDRLKLSGYDTELGIDAYIDAKIDIKGRAAAPAKTFSEIIRKLPDGDVIIEVDSLNMKIRSGSAKFDMRVFDGIGFPEPPKIISNRSITIDQSNLKDMISKSVFIVSPQNPNQVYTGELFICRDGSFEAVATDTNCMAISRKKIDSGDFQAIIPGKTLTRISKLLGTGDVNIEMNNNMAIFEMSNYRLVSRLIDGSFIDYKRLYPKEFKTEISIDRMALLQTLERAGLLSDKEAPTVLRTVSDSVFAVEVVSTTAAFYEELSAEITGKIEIGFNHSYWVNALKSISDEKVKIKFTHSKGPAIIENDEYLHILVPVRMKNA